VSAPTTLLGVLWEAQDNAIVASQRERIDNVREASEDLLYVTKRILAAHDSGNNGAVMGEARLCPYFADALRAALARLAP
jgi:hypothetical protein